MNSQYEEVALGILKGKTIKEIKGLKKESQAVTIITDDGNEYMFYHDQDCRETVDLNDYEGVASELTGALILSAEEVSSDSTEEPEPEESSFTWTFYKIETSKGGIWMRWLGQSNGYYSESVDFIWVNKPV